jgi:hypothetical protein
MVQILFIYQILMINVYAGDLPGHVAQNLRPLGVYRVRVEIDLSEESICSFENGSPKDLNPILLDMARQTARNLAIRVAVHAYSDGDFRGTEGARLESRDCIVEDPVSWLANFHVMGDTTRLWGGPPGWVGPAGPAYMYLAGKIEVEAIGYANR